MLRHPLPSPISFISLIILVIYSLPAGAVTFTVTNLNDSGAGSLRQAVLDANAAAGDDTIQFQSGLSGTILLASQLVITTNSNLTINGPGASVLAVSGNNATRIFSTGSTTTINNLTLKNGRSSTGGAIYAGGTMTINQCVLSNNVADSGGAIDNLGTMTITNSILSGNSAVYQGGAINNRETLTVSNSTLSGNSATATAANTSAGWGGGIYSYPGSILTIANSTLSGNSATNSSGFGGHGGAIKFNGGKKLMIINSTLSGNSANSPTCPTFNNCSHGKGGGLYASWQGNADDQMTVRDSTFTGNTAVNHGGGIYLDQGTLTVGNSIVSGNNAPNGKEVAANNPSASSAKFVSLGHNLFGENGAAGLVNASPIASDLILAGAIDTALGELADNGGPTQTQLPTPGSPALNAGDNALVPAGTTTDQRGSGFSRIVNNVVDIGAAEVQPPGSLVAGLTSSGQIYYTTIASPTAGDEEQLAAADAMGALPRANAWGNIPGQLAQLRIGDFNGDGEGDLIGVANNGSLWYTTNRGPWASVPGGLSQISVGDFNGDGKDGLIGLAGNGSIWYTNDLSAWTQAPGQLAQLQTGDLNGDGKADLAGLASNGSVWYTTDLSAWTQAPGQLAQLQVGDFNGDGKADLVGVAGNSSVWYTTNLSAWAQLPGALSQLTTSDLNGDGKADLVGLANNGSIWYATDLSAWTNLPGQLAQLAGH